MGGPPDGTVPLRVQLRWILRRLRPRWLRRSAMSTRATSLGEMSQAELSTELYERRASYQRALSAVVARGEVAQFERSVANLLTDVQVIRGGQPLKVTMYAATVTEEPDGGFDIRGVYATIAEACRRLETEAGTLEWQTFGEHHTTRKGKLAYHIDPVEVKA